MIFYWSEKKLTLHYQCQLLHPLSLSWISRSLSSSLSSVFVTNKPVNKKVMRGTEETNLSGQQAGNWKYLATIYHLSNHLSFKLGSLQFHVPLSWLSWSNSLTQTQHLWPSSIPLKSNFQSFNFLVFDILILFLISSFYKQAC